MAPPTVPLSIDTRRWARLTLQMFAALLALMALLAWPLEQQFNARQRSMLTEHQRSHLAAASAQVEREIAGALADLGVLLDSTALQNYLSHPTAAHLQHLQNRFFTTARGYQRYGKISLIDAQGQERVRVDHKEDGTAAVPATALQNKAAEPFFAAAMRLHRGDMYLSSIDLNRERGRVEVPIKPVLRVAAPVFSPGGEQAGILVMNLLAELLRTSLARLPSGGQQGLPMVVTQEGQWVSHPDATREFGQALEGTAGPSFSQAYPEEWARMADAPAGVVHTAKGLFNYQVVDPLPSQATGLAPGAGTQSDARVYLLFQLTPEMLAAQTLHAQPWAWALALLVVALMLLAAITLGFWVVFRAAQLTQAKTIAHQMTQAAYTDELTGVCNRRHFRELAQRELRRVQRMPQPLVLLMLDIDHFKRINDRHGHDVGDRALQQFSQTCQQRLRSTDIFARLGGEEFAVLMPDTPLEAAAVVAEQLRAAVEGMTLTTASDLRVPVTVSIGMAPLTQTTQDLDALLQQADTALYDAKHQGRNRVAAFAALRAVAGTGPMAAAASTGAPELGRVWRAPPSLPIAGPTRSGATDTPLNTDWSQLA